MKIAIQSNQPRGKEIISLLESFGGNNKNKDSNTIRWTGDSSDPMLYYYIGENGYIQLNPCPKDYKLYTLEQFEKEFPFKVGDEVIALGDQKLYKIIAFEYYNDKLCYKLNNSFHYKPQALKFYKEMKEERNITLTLDKAKEWYNKGGELKEVALQAFSEKELTKIDLPKTWEEFCKNYPIKEGECYLYSRDMIQQVFYSGDRNYKNWIPSRKSAEAHLAMIQLEQLRNCYNNSCNDTNRIAIINNNGNIELYVNPPFNCFLTFKNHLLAREFFSNFKEIIEIAKKLI